MDLKKIQKKIKSLSKSTIFSIVGALAAVIVTSIVIYSNETKSALESKKQLVITNNKAEEYFYEAQYDKAIEQYKVIEQKKKEEPIWEMKIAEVYSVKNDIENSRKSIEKVKEFESKDPELLNYIVFTELMNSDYSLAMKDGEKALTIAPKDKKLIKTMFTVYMANKMLDKAKSLIENYPVDSKSAYDMAEYSRMLMIVGQKEQGFEKLREAWYVDKDEYKVYDVLSQISVYSKNKLLEEIFNLSKKSPEELAYKMWLAKIYSLNESTAGEAAKMMDSLEGKDIGKIEGKLIQATILQNTNEIEKADKLINKLIAENKDDYRALHTAGWYYLNKGEFLKAENYCKQSILKNKDYPDNYGFLMPQILRGKGKDIEGEPYFRTAMLKEPYNYNIMLTIANYYSHTSEDSKMALEYFKFAEIVKPDDAEIKYNMAMIYINDKNNNEAVRLLTECIKLEESVPKYHRTLGTIHFLNGDYKNSIAEIRFAYNADQYDILTLNNAGCYYLSVDGDIERGHYNLLKAKEGLNKDMDKYIIDTINANFEKADKLKKEYNSESKADQTLKVPEFIMFY